MPQSKPNRKVNAVGNELAAVLPQHSKSWITQPHLLQLNFYILIVLLSSVTLGFDGSMMNGLLSLDTWNDYFGTPRSSLLGLINAVLSLGLLAAIPAGIICDKFGRKASILVGIAFLLVATALQSAAQNVAMFIVSRFLIGVGIEFSSMPAPVLVTELAYPTHRGKLTSLYNCFFYVGAIASSWITFGTFSIDSTWSWRIPSILQAFFPLVQLAFIWSVPESPRWLISKGRTQEAREIFAKYHAGGDVNHPLVEFEVSEITHYVQSELESSSMSWSSLWATKADRRRLLIIVLVPFISQWAGNGLITYYLSLVLDTVGITSSFTQTLINGILQIFNAFAAVFGSMLVDRLGRRTLWLWSAAGMLISYVAWTVCSAVNFETGNSTAGIMVIVFIFIYFFHYDIAVTPFTWSYPAEILPFHTRSKGMAIVNLLNGVTLLFNAFVNSIAISAIQWKYYIVYDVLLVIILLTIFFLFPETRGRSLEEISELFESGVPAWQTSKMVFGSAHASHTEKEAKVETTEDVEK
ncbi:general substrate transporter [Thozetella sp. PMI_491]|nr:general substrate transporter [Thozetella sp. PMI_491]